jgi:23S rRNA-/tRNA-specific pseudouridylate synthase
VLRDFQYTTIAKNDNFLIVYKHPGYSIGENTSKNDLLSILHNKFNNQYIQTIFHYQSYISGIVILVKNKQLCDEFRNLYGSQKMSFDFQCIAQRKNNVYGEITCDLPIAQHSSKDIMLISNKTGKKAHTKFSIIENINDSSLIYAETNYLRDDQILLHAYESGLYIYGDEKYAHLSVPTLESFKRKVKSNRKGDPAPLYHGPCVYLSKISITFPNDMLTKYLDALFGLPFEINKNIVSFSCEMPDKMKTFVKILKQWA